MGGMNPKGFPNESFRKMMSPYPCTGYGMVDDSIAQIDRQIMSGGKSKIKNSRNSGY